MLRIYACIVTRHDPQLIAAALAILFLAITAGSSLLRHAQGQPAGRRGVWTAGAGLAIGCGAWAAHFISVLALSVAFPIRFKVSGTAFSLAIALSWCSVGLHIALESRRMRGQVAGALIVASGIAAMHFTGILALQFPGTITWDGRFIALSVLLIEGLAAASILLTLRARARWQRVSGIALLVAGVLSLHFVAMTAMTFRLGGATGAVPGGDVSARVIGICVALVCAVILSLCLLTLQLNHAAARRREAEQANIRSLADISVEGLLVCDGTTIISANTSFQQMTGYREAALRGSNVVDLLDGANDDSSVLPGQLDNERLLIAATGERIPVEVVSKPILYAKRMHRVLALRDLRERRKADEIIRFLAHHDPLTGLVNRTAFNAVLARHLRDRQQGAWPFALLAIDLDRFKSVNDAFGHQGGDELLKLVAGRLREALRDEDCIARLGGDEFAVLATPPMSADTAVGLANRIVDVLSERFFIGGAAVTIGASVGVAFAPDDGTEPAALLRHADLALYRAKSSGRSTALRYAPSMDAESAYRRGLEQELREALDKRQFELRYQPLYCVRRQAISGFEALLRWHHPERGVIPPGEFIPLAEGAAMIGQIGEFVLNAAVEEAAHWAGDAYVAVNLSPLQIKSGKLVDTVRAALGRSGLAPNRLELEITENVLLQDNCETVRTLHALRALGVRIALDDFGTGYSSLHYLRAFPFDRIKIDRSFIGEMHDNDESAAIISAVVALSRRLGILTTAEGVETVEQFSRVEAEGCDTVQGYFIGRPAPADEAREMLGGRVLAAV